MARTLPSPSRPPLLVRPRYVLKPWGGRRLHDVLLRAHLPDGPVGESWDIADLESTPAQVDGGPHDGAPLRDLLGGRFPLLLKVIDAAQALSVQVHPDGLDGAVAKEEAWVALSDGGAVALGCVTSRTLPAPGRWLDCLETAPLRAGSDDASVPPSLVHVPPGTVHAILAGSLLFEVQNPVDETWRLDDHGRVGLDGRPRALHLDQARDLLRRGPATRVNVSRGGTQLRAARFDVLLHPPHQVASPSAGPPARAAFFMRGGDIRWSGGRFEVPVGRSVVLPPDGCRLHSGGWVVEVGLPA